MDRISSLMIDRDSYLRLPKKSASQCDCPICGTPMVRAAGPIGAQGLCHAMSLANQFDFFVCPNRGQEWHKVRVKVLELLVWYWSRPLEELLMKSDNDLCRTVRIGNTDTTGRSVGAEQSAGTDDSKPE